MKTNWTNYFYFSRKQRNGIVILVSLISLLFFGAHLLPEIIPKQPIDHSKFEEEIAAFEATLKPEENEARPIIAEAPTQLFSFNPNTVTESELIQLGLTTKVAQVFINFRNSGFKFYKKEDLKKVYGITESDYQRLSPFIHFPPQKKKKPKRNAIEVERKKKPLTPFPFNPNTATKTTFLQLGLSEKIANTVINYRNKGGQFWRKQDFSKIYGLDSTDYFVLEPYIEIPPSKPMATKPKNIPKDIPTEFSIAEAIKIDVNQATVADWEKLKGIGPVTAKRIVNFREKLGGFLSIEQIKSTYHVPDSVIELNKNQLLLSPITKKIPINTITPEALKLHPYIATKEAYLIVNYRTNHGNFASLEDLRNIKALNADLINQISPYISYD